MNSNTKRRSRVDARMQESGFANALRDREGTHRLRSAPATDQRARAHRDGAEISPYPVEDQVTSYTEKYGANTEGRDSRGRFGPGNNGRPPGARNRRTLIAEALIANEEEALARKAVALALGGDSQMLRFLLGPFLPKERPIRISLPPLDVATDAIEALGVISRALSEGVITPSEGAAISSVLADFSRSIDVAELESRIDAVEQSIKEN
jgi:hypothetical protein